MRILFFIVLIAQRPAGIPTIRVGQTLHGTLSATDSLHIDSTHYKMYQFTARPGRIITIDLASDDFDPVLIVRGDDLEHAIIDDDGGPRCAARISRAFQSARPYTILVNTTATPRAQTGRFTLSITAGRRPLQREDDLDCRRAAALATVHTISVGETQHGQLTPGDVLVIHDSTYAQAWSLRARAGQTVTIDLESDAFDAYLFLRGPGLSGGRDFQDDDSGGNCNARLTVTFPRDTVYEIDVNSQGSYATGAFTLAVTKGAKPKSVQRCSRFDR